MGSAHSHDRYFGISYCEADDWGPIGIVDMVYDLSMCNRQYDRRERLPFIPKQARGKWVNMALVARANSPGRSLRSQSFHPALPQLGRCYEELRNF